MDVFVIRTLVKFRKLNRTVNKNDLNGKSFIWNKKKIYKTIPSFEVNWSCAMKIVTSQTLSPRLSYKTHILWRI